MVHMQIYAKRASFFIGLTIVCHNSVCAQSAQTVSGLVCAQTAQPSLSQTLAGIVNTLLLSVDLKWLFTLNKDGNFPPVKPFAFIFIT